jgi:Divergent InlB B-repeat domain
MPRPVRIGLVLVALAILPVLTGCSAQTTGATDITATSATLKFSANFGDHDYGSWWLQYMPVGGNWAQASETTHIAYGTAGSPCPASSETHHWTNVPVAVTGLMPSRKYVYRFAATNCGSSGPFYYDKNGQGGGTNYDEFTTLPQSYALTVSTNGSGSVTASGINCPGDCSENYNSGTQVTLTESPAAGNSFAGWSGACTGTSSTCTVTMSAAKSVTATFSSGVILPSGQTLQSPQGNLQLIDGHWQNSDGLVWDAWSMQQGASRVFQDYHVVNNTAYNGRFMAWSGDHALDVDPPLQITDSVFEHVAADPPGSMNGTGEANLWVGGTANVNRVEMRDAAAMGLWTGGSCHNSLFQNMLIENQPAVGIYMEHNTTFSTFQHFAIHSHDTGINVEWSYGGGGSHDVDISDFDITIDDPNSYAIFLDGGTYGFHIHDGIIRGGKGIYVPEQDARYMVDPSDPNVIQNVTRPDGSPVPVLYHQRPWSP